MKETTEQLAALEPEENLSEEMMGGFPMYKFKDMKNKEKKHLVITLGNGKKMKAWQYLDFIVGKLKARTKNPSKPAEQLIDPQTGKKFMHDSEVKARWNDRGLLGINEYIDYVNKSLGIITTSIVKEMANDMAKAKQRRILEDIFGDVAYEQPINQKQKGNENERVTARFLREWTGQEFIRTPSSGGRRLHKNDLFVGDVVCGNKDFDFPIVVETKHYAKVNLNVDEAGQFKKKSMIYPLWQQVEDDGKRANKMPILFIRENNMPAVQWFVFMPKIVFDAMAGYEIPKLVFGTSTSGTEIVGIDSQELLKLPFEKFAHHINSTYICTESVTSSEQ